MTNQSKEQVTNTNTPDELFNEVHEVAAFLGINVTGVETEVWRDGQTGRCWANGHEVMLPKVRKSDNTRMLVAGFFASRFA